MIGRDEQTPEAAAMDRHQNELSIALGMRARTWDEVKQGAQEIIDRSDRSGNGANGGAVWLPESEWKNHPKEEKTGKEKPPSGWNWPNIDWSNGRVPNPMPYTSIPTVARSIATSRGSTILSRWPSSKARR